MIQTAYPFAVKIVVFSFYSSYFVQNLKYLFLHILYYLHPKDLVHCFLTALKLIASSRYFDHCAFPEQSISIVKSFYHHFKIFKAYYLMFVVNSEMISMIYLFIIDFNYLL